MVLTTQLSPPVILTPRDLRDLALAKLLLENPSLTARLANVVGIPIEKLFALLPQPVAATAHRVTRAALWQAADIALTTLRSRRPKRASRFLHKVIVGISGAVGGAFGLPALLIELPFSTTIMLRSIGDIARMEGHDLKEPATKLNCLEVFALGGRSPTDDAAESAYWAVRGALAKSIAETAAYLTEKGILGESAPALARYMTTVPARFGIVVSEETAAKAIPILGALGGSVLNVLFLSHFQRMARGHFIVRRLEKYYGAEAVHQAYLQINLPRI